MLCTQIGQILVNPEGNLLYDSVTIHMSKKQNLFISLHCRMVYRKSFLRKVDKA